MADDTATPSLWQFVPAVATLAGGALSLAGGAQAAKGAEGAGDASKAAGDRAAAAYRDLGARIATSERIKASRTKAADEFAAQQAEVSAGQQLAAAQRDAIEEKRQAKLVASRAIAVAAASGAGASDPSVAYLVGRTKGEGMLRAANDLYAGEDKARVLRMQAAAKHYEGLTAEEAGELNAQDALAANEAKAKAEEAKGVSAQEAGRVNAQAATNKGLQGALPALSAIPAALSLYDKYNASTGWGNPNGMGGTARDSGVDMTPEEADAASKAWGDDLASVSSTVESNTIAANINDQIQNAASLDDAANYAASAAEDFAWLELI